MRNEFTCYSVVQVQKRVRVVGSYHHRSLAVTTGREQLRFFVQRSLPSHPSGVGDASAPVLMFQHINLNQLWMEFNHHLDVL